MNISPLSGVVFAAIVVWLGIIHPAASARVFFDWHAVLIVVGGTIAVGLISYPLARLASILNFFLMGVIFKRIKSDLVVAKEILLTYHELVTHPVKFEVNPNYHPFLVESCVILKKAKFSADELNKILFDRINFVKKSYNTDAKILRSMAKFPPGFGLLGAVGSMILVLNETTSPGNTEITQGLSLALVAMMWGVGLSNLFLLPVADRANKAAQEEVHTRAMIMDAVILMHNRGSFTQLTELVNGYLAFDVRRELKNFTKQVVSNIDPVVQSTVTPKPETKVS